MHAEPSYTDPAEIIQRASGAKLYQKHLGYRIRGRVRLGMSDAEVTRMVEAFAASHGGITMAPPAYATISRQYRL